MPTRRNFRERIVIRQASAKAREAERAQRGDQGQLSHLEHLGFGECREAQRLRQKLGKG